MKRIEEEWLKFKDAADRGGSRIDRGMMRRIFYAGAMTLFDRVVEGLDDNEEDLFEEIEDEILEFGREIGLPDATIKRNMRVTNGFSRRCATPVQRRKKKAEK